MEVPTDRLSVRDAYALLIASIIPRPVAWISTLDAGGQRNLAPFSFFMGVGSAPPMLAVSVAHRQGEPKDTGRNIRDTGEFVVNICPRRLAEKMVLTSGEYPRDVDEFTFAGIEPVASNVVRPPGVKESPLRMECRLHQIIKPGSNPTDLVLGEIVHFTIDDAMLTEGMPDAAKLDPIARLGGPWYAGLDALIAIPRPPHGMRSTPSSNSPSR